MDVLPGLSIVGPGGYRETTFDHARRRSQTRHGQTRRTEWRRGWKHRVHRRRRAVWIDGRRYRSSTRAASSISASHATGRRARPELGKGAGRLVRKFANRVAFISVQRLLGTCRKVENVPECIYTTVIFFVGNSKTLCFSFFSLSSRSAGAKRPWLIDMEKDLMDRRVGHAKWLAHFGMAPWQHFRKRNALR